MSSDHQELRYERKTSTRDLTLAEVLYYVRKHPLLFSEIYHSRQINSIYFDLGTLRHYHENINGITKRKKIRLRWYGSKTGRIENPKLEIKEKRNLVGGKRRFLIPDFDYPASDVLKTIRTSVLKSEADLDVKEYFKYLKPSILCSYQRRYFLSADKNFRLTVDFDLEYTRLDQRCLPITQKRDSAIVVELKYDGKYDQENLSILGGSSLRVGKNSKYVNAVHAVRSV